MIRQIDNKIKEISERIYLIFQASYKVEAKLLNATDFPPLQRTVDEFMMCDNVFFAYYLAEHISAVIELDNNHNISMHIQSLVVDPRHFRKGIGRKLVSFVLNHYKSHIFTVETGIDNQPAINLYKRFKFKEIKQWDTNHGVRKIRFERILDNN